MLARVLAREKRRESRWRRRADNACELNMVELEFDVRWQPLAGIDGEKPEGVRGGGNSEPLVDDQEKA